MRDELHVSEQHIPKCVYVQVPDEEAISSCKATTQKLMDEINEQIKNYKTDLENYTSILNECKERKTLLESNIADLKTMQRELESAKLNVDLQSDINALQSAKESNTALINEYEEKINITNENIENAKKAYTNAETELSKCGRFTKTVMQCY